MKYKIILGIIVLICVLSLLIRPSNHTLFHYFSYLSTTENTQDIWLHSKDEYVTKDAKAYVEERFEGLDDDVLVYYIGDGFVVGGCQIVDEDGNVMETIDVDTNPDSILVKQAKEMEYQQYIDRDLKQKEKDKKISIDDKGKLYHLLPLLQKEYRIIEDNASCFQMRYYQVNQNEFNEFVSDFSNWNQIENSKNYVLFEKEDLRVVASLNSKYKNLDVSIQKLN
ncbi:hypothetical protein [Floccifex sp.]|uniref:hypothetical protein n=1 Tax=Floccifex sp. TaxID=2815810 RepID=UPI003F085D2B